MTIKEAVDEILARVELPDYLTTGQRRKVLTFARQRAIQLNSTWYPDIRDADPEEQETLIQHAASEFAAGMDDLLGYIFGKSNKPTLH
jgi:hypothetical protein